MTVLGTLIGRGSKSASSQGQQTSHSGETNVGGMERIASVATGAILASLGLSRRSLPGLLVAAAGGAMVHRGVTGNCRLYGKLGINTATEDDATATQRDREQLDARGIHVEQAFLINRPAHQLYAYWRDLTNLPKIMTHLKEVRVIDDRRSHWTAKAPRIVGGAAEWDAEIVRDEPNSVIAWRSLPGSEITNAGEIRFNKAPGDRGTQVHVSMEYLPPAGKLGHWLATLFGEAPRRQMRDDLRNFKRVMEIGELPTVAGQPRGTCMGEGKLENA
jgi:uncharacterized membrane protein